MRIEGTFLRSKVARRVFWALLAAALLPLATFGVLGYQALSDHLHARDHRSQVDQAKAVGLRVYDRLNAANGVLAAYAASANWADPGPTDPAVLRSLSGVITWSADGDLVGGNGAIAGVWRQITAQSSSLDRKRFLWWAPKIDHAPARVFLSHLDEAGRGWWVAEVRPELLWSDFVDGGIGDALCVRDAAQSPLRCPVAPDGSGASWSLFLGSMGAGDWRFERATGAQQVGLQGLPLGTLAIQGLATTMLVIVALGLIVVRRTMQPLEQLTASTQRLAAQDWSARALVQRGDEFGELAASFNTMAERVGRQVQAMQVQSDIDRAILAGIDIPEVMRHVVARLKALAPGAQAAVVVCNGAGQASRVHRMTGSAAVPPPPVPWPSSGSKTDLDRMQRAPQRLQTWAQGALAAPPGLAPEVHGMLAQWHGQSVALLLLGGPELNTLDGETQREIAELRDRVTVALAAASREALLKQRATRDALTGLLNTRGMHEAFDRLELEAATAFSVLFIDLDAFKDVNDTLGHQVGDELLCAVAGRLQELVPSEDALCRNGGDEFVVLHAGHREAAEQLAQSICDALATPFSIAGNVLHIGASVGIASSPDHGSSRDELMRKSDMAMYAAKASGRARWRTYDSGMDERAAERAWIARDLRVAMADGQLTLHYQPRIDLRTGRADSAEALLRWQHPTRGMVPPLRFISVAEETSLILPLGRWVLRHAMKQLRAWRDAGVPMQRVAVNVSARQLEDVDFVPQVLGLLGEQGLSANDLEIEITESLFLGDSTVACERLASLRALGVLVALDDFGTGYSSLSALHRLPVDVLKIDRAFVTELGGRDSADAVARSIVALARALGKRVVAEGVETTAQRNCLVALGCDEVQGYLYSRPLPPDQLAQRLLGETPLLALEAV